MADHNAAHRAHLARSIADALAAERIPLSGDPELDAEVAALRHAAVDRLRERAVQIGAQG